MQTRLVLALLVTLVGCGGRKVQSVDGATPGSGSESDAAPAKKSSCRYPNGTCDFDSDCAEGQRCDGAMHTTGVPHTFVCRGVCVPEDDDEGRPTCVPPSEAVQVELVLQPGPEGEYLVRETNIGCEPLYRMHTCCDSPTLAMEVGADPSGDWELSPCNPSPAPCLPCDAEPTCDPALAPGETLETRWPFAGCSCPWGSVRMTSTYFSDGACTVVAGYYSNELLLGCAGGAP